MLNILLVHNINELMQCLLRVWNGMDQSITDNPIDEWCERLEANGGRVEELSDSVNMNSAI